MAAYGVAPDAAIVPVFPSIVHTPAQLVSYRDITTLVTDESFLPLLKPLLMFFDCHRRFFSFPLHRSSRIERIFAFPVLFGGDQVSGFPLMSFL